MRFSTFCGGSVVGSSDVGCGKGIVLYSRYNPPLTPTVAQVWVALAPQFAAT